MDALVMEKCIEADALALKSEANKVSSSFCAQHLNFTTNNDVNVRRVHRFYFVKYFPSIEEPGITATIRETERLIHKLTQIESEIDTKLQKLRLDQNNKFWKRCHGSSWYLRNRINWNIGYIELLKQALDEFYGESTSNKPNPRKVVHNCSPNEENHKQIMSLNKGIHHASRVNLVKEREYLKQIKQAQAEREKVIADEALESAIRDISWRIQKRFLSSKKALVDQIKVVSSQVQQLKMTELRRESSVIRYEEERSFMKNEIRILERELDNVKQKKSKASQRIRELKAPAAELNARYYQHQTTLKNAKEVAKRKDVTALQELSIFQVEKHMREWNNNKAFREDYHKTTLLSAVNSS